MTKIAKIAGNFAQPCLTKVNKIAQTVPQNICSKFQAKCTSSSSSRRRPPRSSSDSTDNTSVP